MSLSSNIVLFTKYMEIQISTYQVTVLKLKLTYWFNIYFNLLVYKEAKLSLSIIVMLNV